MMPVCQFVSLFLDEAMKIADEKHLIPNAKILSVFWLTLCQILSLMFF